MTSDDKHLGWSALWATVAAALMGVGLTLTISAATDTSSDDVFLAVGSGLLLGALGSLTLAAAALVPAWPFRARGEAPPSPLPAADLVERLACLLFEGRTIAEEHDRTLLVSVLEGPEGETMGDALPRLEAALEEAPKELNRQVRDFDLRAVELVGPGEAVLMMGAQAPLDRDVSPEMRQLQARLAWITARIERLTNQ